jgi:transglutaminase-like putative cysteine protease
VAQHAENMNPKAEPGPRALLLAEVALTSVTVAAVLGLGRLFVDGSFLPPVLLFAVLAHALAAALRRGGVGALSATLAAIVGLVLAVSCALLRETTNYLLPTSETLAQAGRELSAAWTTFTSIVAPAPVEAGFVLAAAAGVWVLAFTADTAAFRTGAVIEAAVPAATLFVFGAALGAPRHREAYTAAFLVAVAAYWLAQRALAQAATPTWLARDTREAPSSLLRAGTLLAVVGVLAAVVIGPNLPGADARGLIPWRASDRDGPTDRVTVSPLVDIRSRIVEQADVEVFRVRTDTRSYWRLTSLEDFDGRIWSSQGTYSPADGELGSAVGSGQAGTTTVTQEFTVEALASIWLPAAFRPVAVDGTEARYDADSNSLLTEEETSDGLVYRVTSELPTLTAEQLGGSTEAPAGVADIYTELPVGFSPETRDLAQAIVQGAATPYDQARRLQDFFRSGEFEYDLTVGAGHGDNALATFLFETRRGYCEQFAGAFAAMARSVGLPARVAVGFTPGQRIGEQFVVRGENGHAWPEVYLSGFGWVAFEPTPGRGIPGGEAWTGVPEQQAAPGEPNTATTLATTTTTAPADGSTPTTTPGFDLGEDVINRVDQQASPWPFRLAVAGALLVLVPVAWAGAVLFGHLVRRRRRRAAAVDPVARVEVAWTEVGEALTRAGAPARPSETPAEYARRAALTTGVDGDLLDELAATTAAAAWSPTGPDEADADAAVAAAATLEEALDASLTRGDRVRRAFDPRPLLPERRERVVIS